MLKQIQQIVPETVKVMALIVLVLTIATPSFRAIGASKTFDIDGISWEVDFVDGGAVLSKAQTGVRQIVSIPSEFDGNVLTGIGVSAFCYNKAITNVTIPNGVTNIGAYAFVGCSSLQKVELPSSLKSIGFNAFGWCVSLESVELPRGCEREDGYVFCGCTNLSDIRVEDGNLHFASVDGVLYDNDLTTLLYCQGQRTSFEIPYGVTKIGDSAFSGVASLESVTFPATLEEIGYGAFQDSGIMSMSLPLSLRVIRDSAFMSCQGLVNVEIPDGVLEIESFAFDGCENLETAIIPPSVERIGECAFNGCCSLQSVTFLGDAPIGGSDLFMGTPDDMKIHVKKSSEGWVLWHDRPLVYDAADQGGVDDDPSSAVDEWRHEEDDGYVILTGDARRGVSTISRHTKGTVTIPTEIDGMPVVEVTPEAFRGCRGLTEILVEPDSAFFTSVDGVLYDADMKTLIRCPQKKTELTIPAGVREIANSAFSGCEDLTTVVLPDTIEHIGMDAFYGCTSLRQITIPASVTVMDSGCLGGCMNLRAVSFQGDAPDVRSLIPCTVQKTDSFGRSLYYVEVQTSDGSRYLTDEVTAWDEYRSVVTDWGDVYTYCASSYPVYETSYWGFYDADLNYDMSGCPDGTGVTTNCHPYAIYDNSEGWGVDEYARTSPNVISYAKRGSCGWNRSNPLVDPDFWCGRAIAFTDDGEGQGDTKISTGTSSSNVITLVTTNIVIHYIMQSAQSTVVAPVSEDVGIVNVIAEISGGNVAIPESWSANFPSFASKFGSDFTQALTKFSGKRDASGNQMFVWQDYVAGTDPTDETDVFRASVTMVGGVPVVSYTPELSEAEAAKRKYTTWGKVRLQDADWLQVEAGHEADYNFFKVSVEMR